MDDLQFEFQGFKPDEKIKNIFSKVSCSVASRVGLFMANAISGDPVVALQKIEGKMRAQIENWKKRRFEKFLERTF
jgi:hypothetical protein